MAKAPSTSIFIDKYHPKKDGKCSISIRVTSNRKKKYYPTKYKLSQEEYALLFVESPKKSHKTILQALVSEEEKAVKIIDDLKSRFTFSLFEKKYARKSGDDENLFTLMSERATELRNEGRISSAVTFECALNSLKKYHKKDILKLEDANENFLSDYQKWMLDEENTLTTVGIYIRNVRTIFNDAIAEDPSLKDLYPFGKSRGKFNIPTGRNIKKALSHEAIRDIYNYVAKSESEAKAKDFWLLTYLANGINVKDIALLKYSNIDGDIIKFHRAKTLRVNTAKPVPISFVITADIQRIINKWGCKSIYKDNYIFPILGNAKNPEEVYKKIQLFVHFINDHMKKIATNLNISSKLTTYVGRHSYATVLQRKGASTEFIGDSIGHGDVSTTQNYLGGFENDQKRFWANELTNFPQLEAV